MKKALLLLFVLVSFNVYPTFGEEGCKIIGGSNTVIYKNFKTSLLALEFSNGIKIAVGTKIYTPNSPITNNISCTVPWVNSYIVKGSCIHGEVDGLPPVVVTCNDCAYGELVEYTTTLECDIDDYAWLLTVGLGLVGFFIIRRKGFVFAHLAGNT